MYCTVIVKVNVAESNLLYSAQTLMPWPYQFKFKECLIITIITGTDHDQARSIERHHEVFALKCANTGVRKAATPHPTRGPGTARPQEICTAQPMENAPGIDSTMYVCHVCAQVLFT